MSAVDVVAGLSTLVFEGAGAVGRSARPLAGALGSAMLRPPLLPRQLHPARFLAPLAERGAAERRALTRSASGWLDALVPMVLTEVLRRVDVTELVLRHLDVDQIVTAADLDEAAARLDVGRVLDRVDVDEVVRRVDVDVVAQRLDLDTFLARRDLTALVLGHVDLDVLVAACLEHLDLVALAEQVIDGVDLPGIIRESTGTMASDTVRGARMQGIAADEAVGRAVDRLLLRRSRRVPAETIAEPASNPAEVSVPQQERREPTR